MATLRSKENEERKKNQKLQKLTGQQASTTTKELLKKTTSSSTASAVSSKLLTKTSTNTAKNSGGTKVEQATRSTQKSTAKQASSGSVKTNLFDKSTFIRNNTLVHTSADDAVMSAKNTKKASTTQSTQASRENSSASKSTQNSVTNKLWIQESTKLNDTKSSFYSDPRTSDSFMFVKNNKAPQLSERNPSRSIAGKTNLLADSAKNTDFRKCNPLSLRQQNIQSSTAQVITPNSKEYLNMLEQKTYETQPLYRSISDAVDQIVLGNYTDKVTLLGTLGQIVLGLTDFDIIGDVRDLTYDLTHINEVPWYQTALDIVGVLPVSGALKYSDETVDTVKGISKASKGIDALADTADSTRTSLRVVNPMSTSFSGTAAADKADDLLEARKALLYKAVKENMLKDEAAATAAELNKTVKALEYNAGVRYNNFKNLNDIQTEYTKAAKASTKNGKVTYYRVQGGTGSNQSKTAISVRGNGKISIDRKLNNLSVSAYSLDHAKYFSVKRGGSEVTEIVAFDIPD